LGLPWERKLQKKFKKSSKMGQKVLTKNSGKIYNSEVGKSGENGWDGGDYDK
jgi:hypothetical protein